MKVTKNMLQYLLMDSEESREKWMKRHQHELDFAQVYKAIEREKAQSLIDGNSISYEKLVGLKAHFEMWDKQFH